MKKIQLIVIGLILPLLLMAQGIQFEKTNLATALKKAKKEHKVVFIDGSAIWCGPCKRMADDIFPLKEVGDYFNQNLLALKIDVERGEGPAIKREYSIEGLPGYVFLDGDGNVVFRGSGAMPAEAFLKLCKQAVESSKDSLSISRLAFRYNKEKDNEAFLKLYLNKLKESNSTNYIDVLEHFLHIQKSINPSSKEMVQLLSDHQGELIFGGEADRIIQEQLKSQSWRQYIRKDIREMFQKLPFRMTERTTNYAIDKVDTSLLEITFRRAQENGINVDSGQRERTYTYYYLMTGNGEKYKTAMYEPTEKFIASLNVESLRKSYMDMQEKIKNGQAPVYKVIPYASKYSESLQYTITTYARFATTDADKQTLKRWAEVAYRLTPGEPLSTNVYADILYFCGEKDKALPLKEEALKLAEKDGVKKTALMEQNYANMKAGTSLVF